MSNKTANIIALTVVISGAVAAIIIAGQPELDGTFEPRPNPLAVVYGFLASALFKPALCIVLIVVGMWLVRWLLSKSEK